VNRARFIEGLELFNQERFFECHEVLEEVWNEVGASERAFLQGLIQVAVGFYHWTRHNPVGAERVLRRALRNLQPYANEHRGVNLSELRLAVSAAVRAIESGSAPEFCRVNWRS
jgi:predicted metal-dependent hydrolase